METTTYQIIDLKTKRKVGKVYKYAQRNRARARADKLDQQYGAYRYIVQPTFSNPA